jgi:prephenate dehydratase
VNIAVTKPRVAFQGAHGAFSEAAAIELLGPEITLLPRKTFEDMFRSLDEGVADYVVSPVENSLIGRIVPAVTLMRRLSLACLDEVTLRIEHHLIACPGASLKEIEKVESHPAALAQCKRFFDANRQIDAVESHDTAASVAKIVAAGDCRRAAIASKAAAAIHGGVILRSNVEDSPDNRTRFLLLSK